MFIESQTPCLCSYTDSDFKSRLPLHVLFIMKRGYFLSLFVFLHIQFCIAALVLFMASLKWKYINHSPLNILAVALTET